MNLTTGYAGRRLRGTSARGTVVIDIQNLHPEVLERFRLYCGRSRELMGASLLRGGEIECGFTISGGRNKPTVYVPIVPDKEATQYVASMLRPFWLKKESIAFSRISDLAAETSRIDSAAAWIRFAKEQFRAIRESPELAGGAIFEPDGNLVPPRSIVDIYMNAEVAHVQIRRQKQLQNLGELEGVARSIFVSTCLNFLQPIWRVSVALETFIADQELEPWMLSPPEDLDATQLQEYCGLLAFPRALVARASGIRYDHAPEGLARFRLGRPIGSVDS